MKSVIKTWLSINFLLIIAFHSYAQDNSPLTFQLQNNTWEQLVLPGNPAGQTIGSLFGDTLNVADYTDTWIVYTYDGVGMRYVDPGINGTVDQAQAFWIVQQTGVNVELVFPANFASANTIQSTNCDSSTGCAEVELATIASSGTWTMVGHPYKEPVSPAQISVVTGQSGSSCNPGCTLDEAATANYTGDELWGYDSAVNDYVNQKDNASIEPLQGFWLSTLANAHLTNPVLLLPDPSSPPVNTNRNLPGVPQAYAYEGTEVPVNNVAELQSAVSNAEAGDVITLSAGLYLAGHKISLTANGSASNPITLRAANVRNTEINFSQSTGIVEGFVVFGSHWIIDGFVLSSACNSGQHSQCEHAIHVKAGAEGLKIRNNRIVDFNAAIKGGGSDNVFANNVRIEHNEIFNTSARMTANPVTPIDINGGDSWLIAKNSIYDFAKGQGNQVSYGAFLKANSSNGVMDSNLLQCQKNIVAPGARVGLSFGGGGNSPINSPVCKDSDCSRLHRNGRMTNNVITNCSDVGVYINASSDSLIDHNTLYSTAGIDVRFDTSTARIIANILVGGSIRERQGGQVTQNEANSLRSTAEIPSLSALPNAIEPHSVTNPALNYDICGYQRQSRLTGAIGGASQQQRTCLADLF